MSVRFEIEGQKELDAYLATFPDRARAEMRDLVEDLGEHAEGWMRLYAPHQQGPAGGSLHRQIKSTQANDTGRNIQSVAGVTDRGSRHPLYVLEGTGLYAEGGSRITPNKPGGVLTFQKHGEPRRFKRSVKGQRPQQYARAAYNSTVLYALGRVSAFARELKS